MYEDRREAPPGPAGPPGPWPPIPVPSPPVRPGAQPPAAPGGLVGGLLARGSQAARRHVKRFSQSGRAAAQNSWAAGHSAAGELSRIAGHLRTPQVSGDPAGASFPVVETRPPPAAPEVPGPPPQRYTPRRAAPDPTVATPVSRGPDAPTRRRRGISEDTAELTLPPGPAPVPPRHGSPPADEPPIIRQRSPGEAAHAAGTAAPQRAAPPETPAGPVPRREPAEAQESETRANRLDMAAVLAAVREVPGVHDAVLRREPGGGQTLRLDLAEAVDPRAVEREVAELLRARLGVNAAPAPPENPVTTPSTTSDPTPPVEAEPPGGVAGHDGSPGVAEGGGDLDLAGDPDRRNDVNAIVASPTASGSDAGLAPPEPIDPGYTGSVAPATRPARRADPLDRATMRVVLERVQVVTAGLEAAVEVGLAVGGIRAVGRAAGPAVEEHVLRAAAAATTDAVDVLLAGRARCAMEHVGTYHASTTEVALVVIMLLSPAGPERLTGAAAVNGDARQAAARATLAALNRRLAALLP